MRLPFHLKFKNSLAAVIIFVMVVIILKPLFVHAQKEDYKTVRVGWYESNYCYTDKFGRKNGLAYEYQCKIAAYAGWRYEYVEGSWPELLQKLRDGEIDLLSDVSYTKERAKEILYPTLPMGQESYYIYVTPDNTEITIDNIESFNGKKCGVNRGSFQEDLLSAWAKEHDVDIEIVEMDTTSVEESLAMLKSGEIDAYCAMDTYGGRQECSPVCKIGASDYYLAVSSQKEDLLNDLNAALVRIHNEDPYYNQKLYEKYIYSVNYSAFLTPDEKKWVNGHGAIRIGFRDNYLPYCDAVDDSGELTGALKEYLERASACMLNEKIDYLTTGYPSAEEAIQAMESGEVDAVFPVQIGLYEAEDKGILVTNPPMRSEIYAVVRKKGGKDISSDDDVRVAVNTGNTSFETFIMDNYPDWKISYYDDSEACFEAVAAGQADCMFVSSYRINQTDRQRSSYDLSLIATGKYIDFSFVVPKEDIELYSILNKSVSLIGDNDASSALSKYAFIKERVTFAQYMMDNREIVIAVVSVISIIILLLMILKLQSDKRAAERQKLITATEYDHVTRLYNRSFFYEYVNRINKEHPDYHYDAIALNLDQFHAVNALNGWAFGDKVLKAMGEEIKSYLDESSGIACRSQADRFSIYCKRSDNYQNLYDRLQRRIDALSINVNISLRMGVMHYQEGIDPVQQFDHARTACNMVRGGHTSKIMVFNEEMRNEELRDQRLLNDLRRALDEHEFLVYFQPKFDVKSNPPKICSAEALVRWQHPELGLIPPGDFIPLFEDNCKINLLDRYVWKTVAEKLAFWRDKYGVTVPVSVNLSRLDVFDPELETVISDIITSNGIDRGMLDLEVTESAYTDNADKVISVVSNLRRQGHHIEMDDFGTGYSSLSMLSSMPVDILKLDRSFIMNLENNQDDARLTELILDIARGLNVDVVAEGVETEGQLQFLMSRGCGMVQGYYFSPPIPASMFEEKYIANTIG
ncbi:MAG: EAL domain-containing protein [Butyrivibrio sp.]|nr:EAL domain-containing protein [Butyrivibrio sp.]